MRPAAQALLSGRVIWCCSGADPGELLTGAIRNHGDVFSYLKNFRNEPERRTIPSHLRVPALNEGRGLTGPWRPKYG